MIAGQRAPRNLLASKTLADYRFPTRELFHQHHCRPQARAREGPLQPAIERHQATTTVGCQRREMEIGYLVVTSQATLHLIAQGIPQRDVVGPEAVPTGGAETRKSPQHVVGSRGHRRIGRVRQHAGAPGFGNRTRCPIGGARCAEPVMGRRVVDVSWIEQRHQEVDVQQMAHGSWSRSRLTRSRSGTAPSCP